MMGKKIWTRLKYKYFRKWNIASMASPIIVLGLIYLIYKQVRTTTKDTMRTGDNTASNRIPSVSRMGEQEMNLYAGALKDTRPQECKEQVFHKLDTIHSTKVSFIMHFRDEQFYLLKLALFSLVKYTAKTLIHEIIVIDDDTQDKYIQKQAQLFHSEERFKGIDIKTFKSVKHEGSASSRVKGALIASGEILVFVDNDVVFNVGWYEPIVDYLLNNPKSIAVPHADAMLSDYQFRELASDLVSMSTWTLTTLHYKVGTSKELTLPSPVMRGEIFAIKRDFYMSLDQLDESFLSGEGSELEFSLRAWLCGGKLEKLQCSRVAVHHALTPKEISSYKNLQRIVELWFGSYSDIVYKQTMQRKAVSEDILRDFKARKNRIMATTGQSCHSLDWYLSNVAHGLLVPDIDWLYMGKFRDMTGHCLKADISRGQLYVELCNPPIYDPDMMFEYTTHDLLRTGGKCLMAQRANVIAFTDCIDKEDLRMKWAYLGGGTIKNKFFDVCLEHVKENSFNDKGKNIHRAVLAKCENFYTQSWEVMKY